MKNFEPMHPDDPHDQATLERQLAELEWKRPPAGWREDILARCQPPVSWLPKPFAAALALCWSATAGFVLMTQDPAPPSDVPPGFFERQLVPLMAPDRELLGFNATHPNL